MAEKTINGRIINKHDIEANWLKAENFVPKNGEIIIYDIDDSYDYTRIKIGDGTTVVNLLPFVTDQVRLELLDEIEDVVADKADKVHRHNYYGVCSTAAGTAAKTVEIDGFELVVGAMIVVKFDNSNSASNPTLNVSGTGAKPMYRYGTTALSTGTTTTGWYADSVQVFVYDGNGWIRDYWNNSTYSNASLGNGYATCTTAAATVAKTATLSSYELNTGGVVSVKFSNDVPAGATLNINSKGAKAMYYMGAAIVDNVIKAEDVATFVYNGTYYHLIAIDRWQKDIEDLKAEVSDIITVEHVDEICGGSIEYAEDVMF